MQDFTLSEKDDKDAGKYPFLVVGGDIGDYSLDFWPAFEGMPLAYLGSLWIDESTRYLIFLDGENNEVKKSWQPENGSNAIVASVNEHTTMPGWIDPVSVEKPILRLTEEHIVPLTDEPKWLQGDESIEDYNFVAQIDSNIDENLNIGDAHGVAYLFVHKNAWNRMDAKLLWQA